MIVKMLRVVVLLPVLMMHRLREYSLGSKFGAQKLDLYVIFKKLTEETG
jgi:hypothetical protein